MKRHLAIVTVSLLLPSLALAAFDDVTLTTSTNISVGGYTLNVTGSSAVVQSITVNDASFSVTLTSGSSIQVTSPTHQQLSVDTGSFTTSNTCATGNSVLALASSGSTGTVTVTPSATVCATVSSGGGGGGRNSGSAPRSVAPVVTTPQGTSTPPVAAGHKFYKNLSFPMTDPEVKQLQIYLNTHGFVLTPTGPGSPGKETNLFGFLTRATLIKFQEAYASQILVPAGLKKGTGYFGPSTRAFVNK